MATTTLAQSTILQPNCSAIAPLIAGPTAPPRSGASITRDIPLPCSSTGKISAMIEGFKTLEAVAKPVKKRAKMSVLEEVADAERAVVMMKRIFAILKTGYRP